MALTTLTHLADRVEAGAGAEARLMLDISKALDWYEGGDMIISIDAVEALRSRLLPGYLISASQFETTWEAAIATDGWGGTVYTGDASTEARARLAAVLRAIGGQHGWYRPAKLHPLPEPPRGEK
jgi:hypothetical protein